MSKHNRLLDHALSQGTFVCAVASTCGNTPVLGSGRGSSPVRRLAADLSTLERTEES